MKILVALKRVADPDNSNKVKVAADASKVETTGLEWKPNPFDEYAVEAALRMTEDGAQPKVRQGEVLVVTFGPKDCDIILRQMLATGADRAIRVESDDEQLDGSLVARALATIVQNEKPDLVMMGKQAVDGDSNQVGQMLAEHLGWPMATFVSNMTQTADGIEVGREVDGGMVRLGLTLPAVVTVDLRVTAPMSVHSLKTKADFRYNDGVRFAPLPAIMLAKKKPLDTLQLSALATGCSMRIRYSRFERPTARKAGVKVKDVAELVQRLKDEAKVI